jgi:hypothetical protein
MGRPLKIQKQGYAGTPGLAVDAGFPQINTLTDPVTPGGLTGTQFYGVVGGNILNLQTTAYNSTVDVNGGSATFPVVSTFANVDGTQNEEALIVRQKGQSKYLVTGVTSGVTGVAFLADVANGALTVNQMSINVSVPDGAGNVGNVNLQRLTNKYGLGYDNVQYFVNFFQPASNVVVTTAKSGADAVTFTNGTGNITMALVPSNP